MAELTHISWALAETPTRWSKDHLSDDDRTTLCGRTIPWIGAVFNYGQGDEPCRSCERLSGRTCTCEPTAPTGGWNPSCPLHGYDRPKRLHP